MAWQHSERVGIYRAWFDCGDGEYHWSNRSFVTIADADKYGKRVADRFNRIFGQEVKDVQEES